jgi:pSer/pThr/pTyr-binding forkhead associated (FHA) protein
MRARLVPLDNTPPIDLNNDLTLVGRTEDCDSQIHHKSVSKFHCVLTKTDGLVFVRDLGSTNGTRVNGTRVRRAALLPNDLLAIAAFRYQVRLGDSVDDIVEPSQTQQELLPDAEESSQENEIEKPRLASPPLQRNVLPDVYDSK